MSQPAPVPLSSIAPFIIYPPPPQPAASKRTGTGEIHPNLPQPPFTLGIIGPRNRGKSVLIRNLLDKKLKGSYGHAFNPHNIIFYSPTSSFDKTVVSLGLKHIYGPKMPPQVLVAGVKAQQESFNAAENMADVLMVWEDCTNTPEAWNIITKLGYDSRHCAIHCIAVAHKLTSVPRGNRTQIQQWCLFKPHEESEREWIIYMFSRLPTRKIWQLAITRAWDIPYNFIYVDFERDTIANVYRSGLNDSLFTPDEIQMLYDIEHGLFDPKKPTNKYKKGERPDLNKDESDDDDAAPPPLPKRKRGRPKGSTNASSSKKQKN